MALLPILNTNQFAPVAENSPNLAIGLLTQYSFDLGGYSASELVNRWRKDYAVSWLRLAIIEALHQGRYKAVSVQQILTLWHRRGQPTYHFNLEFENLICSKLPEDLTAAPNSSAFVANKSDSQGKKSQNQKVTSFPLNGREGALNGRTSQPVNSQSVNSQSVNSRSVNSQPVTPRLKAATQKKLYPSYEQHQHKTSSGVNTPPQEKYRQLQPSARTITPGITPSITSGRRQRYLPPEKHSLSHREEFLLESQSTAANKLAKFLPPPDVNHPPIGQFTPEKSDNSELFTSKLRAIAREETDNENSTRRK